MGEVIMKYGPIYIDRGILLSLATNAFPGRGNPILGKDW